MNILVLMKQVVSDQEPGILEDGFILDRGSAGLDVNPTDCAALEHALAVKEACGGTVTVLSMGSRRAEPMLREILALPVDRVVLLTDPDLAGSDTLATAGALAAAAGRLGKFDLYLFGRRAVDGETGQVGPETSVLLGRIPCVTNVTELYAAGDAVECRRLLEREEQVLTVPLPAALTVCGGATALRPPTIAGMRRAAGRKVEIMTADDAGIPAGRRGLAGSATRVAAVSRAEPVLRHTVRYTDAAEGAEAVVRAFRSRKLEPARPAGNRNVPGTIPGSAWIVCRTDDLEDCLTAREICGRCRDAGMESVRILCIGEKEPDEALLRSGADRILRIAVPESADDRVYARIAAQKAREGKAGILLFPATVRGRAVAPLCAAELETGLTADCTGIEFDDSGQMIQIRPAFGGQRIARVRSERLPQMATVRPHAFLLPDLAETPSPLESAEEAEEGTVALKERFRTERESLSDADAIVSGGKGVGAKGFETLKLLAGAMNGTVGASRAAVHAGYISYPHQVGQTGVIVKPEFYLAFGISGAVQHLVGIRNAGTVISVNPDPDAPIHSAADIAVIAGWEETAGEILERLRD